MPAEEYPLIAGQHVSWAEIKPVLSITGAEDFATKDFAAIDWDEALTPGKVKGVGPMMIGRTVGEHDANASMSMYYAKSMEFQRALLAVAQAKGHQRIALVKFDLICSWEPLDGDGEVFTVKLVGCRLAGRSVKSAPSADATVKEMPLSIIRIEEDGISLV